MSAVTDSPGEWLDARTPLPGKQSLRLWLRMLRCTSLVEKTVRNRLIREFGTTLPRFDVMAALHRHPEGMTMGELSEHLLVSNGNVTGPVGRLEADGFVKRQALASDRRKFRVKLTAKGKRAFEAMARVHEKWIDDMFRELPGREVQQLHDLLGGVERSAQDAISRENTDGR